MNNNFAARVGLFVACRPNLIMLSGAAAAVWMLQSAGIPAKPDQAVKPLGPRIIERTIKILLLSASVYSAYCAARIVFPALRSSERKIEDPETRKGKRWQELVNGKQPTSFLDGWVLGQALKMTNQSAKFNIERDRVMAGSKVKPAFSIQETYP